MLAPTQQPTTKTISNITNIESYKNLNHIKYYSSHLINNTHSHLQEMKNTSNLNLNHLITLCKPPACSNTTTHHKTNFQLHKYRVLQVFKLKKNIYILFFISNQQYSFIFAINEKYFQYVFKSPYTIQAICFLQHNNPPQNQLPSSQV